MHILLATGIFPPEIGGPATYVRDLAMELTARGDEVTVVTYGSTHGFDKAEGYWIVHVGKQGGPLGRWLRFREALITHGSGADYLCAFSSISAGIPVLMSGLKRPKKILRLGGDFFWERYTDAGGMMTLREWYASRFGFWRMLNSLCMGRILRGFDSLVYSTEFQRDIHQNAYKKLPLSSVEQNIRPASTYAEHTPRVPFRLLFMGRFVRFKNIASLIDAVALLPDVRLTIIGDGPVRQELNKKVEKEGLESRISFRGSVSGNEKRKAFDDHDLLVLPSLTEISPNVALEARAACLPVLLTEETGLAQMPDIYQKKLRRPAEIAAEIREIIKKYPQPKVLADSYTYQKISNALFPPRS